MRYGRIGYESLICIALNLQEMGFPKNWKFLDVWK